MPKDSLADALFELKDRERKQKPKNPRSSRPHQPKVRRGRPKAFDPFYLFSTILIGLGIALQVVAIFLYA